jgi:hypothetical protein
MKRNHMSWRWGTTIARLVLNLVIGLVASARAFIGTGGQAVRV